MSDTSSQPAPPALEAWLAENLPGYRGPASLHKAGYGQSNPTYRLAAQSGHTILRRKPFGPLLPKAHAIEREFRVLRALEASPVPTPRALALCEDAGVIGAAFYIMEFCTGRIFYDQTLPGMAREERAAIYAAMNRAAADLHRVDPAAVGLSDYGRAEGFLTHQIALWTRQYRAAESGRIEAMERLIDWLPANLPPEQPPAIFHGDLRIDNMVFHATEPRVVAILDWELSTIGDPLADFAYHTMVWRTSPQLFRGLAGIDFAATGIPTEAEYLAQYLANSGRTELPAREFYLAFSMFRLCAILQGISHRAQTGQASSADAAEVGARAAPLAGLAWEIARGAG